MMTSFELANVLSIFQRYINWALQNFLNKFCSAYVDNILIFTDELLHQHRNHVWKILLQLQEVGLQIDIDKCEFEVKSTKYLEFILKVKKGIQMNPQKVKTIMNWQVPKSVKGVQSFIDFANFYWKFIKNFSNLIMLMMAFVQKNTSFKWTEKVNQDFMKLKAMFISAPILVLFDHTCMTVMKTDSSGWCIDETLLQLMNNVWRPCAYYSKKNAPAECNYEIYDKEMLIIIQCLKEWDAELRSVSSFQICTNHKNLKYFITVKKLTEQQMRWSLILLWYNFFILYLLSKQNERTDALLRQKQNVSMSLSDDRVQHCTTQMIHSEMIKQAYTGCLNDSSRHIDLCTHTRSELVQWDHRPQTDVSECWSRRWVVQWALSDNSQRTKIIFYCFKSEGIHNKMLLEWWREATLSQKTLSVVIRTSLYRTDSVYTWLNNDWTLKKRCNWCSLITTVLLIWDATECLYILLKLQQMLYEQQLKRLLTRLLEAFTCIRANLMKDIYQLCSRSIIKWGLYEPSAYYRLF